MCGLSRSALVLSGLGKRLPPAKTLANILHLLAQQKALCRLNCQVRRSKSMKKVSEAKVVEVYVVLEGAGLRQIIRKESIEISIYTAIQQNRRRLETGVKKLLRGPISISRTFKRFTLTTVIIHIVHRTDCARQNIIDVWTAKQTFTHYQQHLGMQVQTCTNSLEFEFAPTLHEFMDPSKFEFATSNWSFLQISLN